MLPAKTYSKRQSDAGEHSTQGTEIHRRDCFATQILSCEFRLHFLSNLGYTNHEVRNVRFQPFVYDSENQQVLATIELMTQQDADETNAQPLWQTS